MVTRFLSRRFGSVDNHSKEDQDPTRSLPMCTICFEHKLIYSGHVVEDAKSVNINSPVWRI
jgi:hypothetical protein